MNVGLRRRITIDMAPSVIGFTLKRSPMVSHFLHFLLVVSCTLVVASCGEARMSAGGFMTERSLEVKMGVASNRRELAGTNITVSNYIGACHVDNSL